MSDKEQYERQKLRVYAVVLASSFSMGLSNPFLGVYAARLGASPLELGFFHSFINFSGNIMQVIWGYIADKVRRYKLIVALSMAVSALMWLLILSTDEPMQFVIFVSIQSLFSSAAAPSWMALLGLLVPVDRMGAVLSRINQFSTLGSLAATMLAGAISQLFRGGIQEFHVPFYLSMFTGVAAAIFALTISQPKIRAARKLSLSVIRLSALNRDFKALLALSSAYGIAMSMAWPLFTEVVGNEMKLGVYEISILTIASNVTSLITQNWAGEFVDRYGKKIFIIIGRTSFCLYPIIYGFAPRFEAILVTNIALNVISAFLVVALQAYILKVTPEDVRATYVALLNMSMGLCFSLGSLMGGIAANYLIPIIGRWAAIRLLFVIAAVARFFVGVLHSKLREPGE